MGKNARREYLNAIRQRYSQADRNTKQVMQTLNCFEIQQTVRRKIVDFLNQTTPIHQNIKPPERPDEIRKSA